MKLNFKKIIMSLFGLAAISVLAYSYFIEPNSIQIEQLNLKNECSGDIGGQINFAQISDLHFTSKTSDNRIVAIYDKIDEQKPSAIFLTGDLISEESGILNATKLAKKISEKYPLYVVFGNWDYWSLDFNVKDFKKALEDVGARVLINGNSKLVISGNEYDILGVKDPYTSGDNDQDIEKSMSGIKSGDKSCKILLAHSPNIIKEAKNRNIDLVLVGHTHGGQVYVPYLTEYFIPSRRVSGKGYVSGLYRVGDTTMYVNRGIGTSVLPLRFITPPEITIINISK